MARVVSLYLPGPTLLAGKAYSPLSLVTTVMSMVEPALLAVTSTPSMAPSSAELTLPDSRELSAAPAGRALAKMKAVRLVAPKSMYCALRMESPPLADLCLTGRVGACHAAP